MEFFQENCSKCIKWRIPKPNVNAEVIKTTHIPKGPSNAVSAIIPKEVTRYIKARESAYVKVALVKRFSTARYLKKIGTAGMISGLKIIARA